MAHVYNFYDKVVKRFGQYHTGAKYYKEFTKDNPEKVFKKNLIALSGKNKKALDLGCADGRFTLLMAPYFKKIVAVDLSKGMLQVAKKLQLLKKIKNVELEKQNARKTTFKSKSFDVIYSRRGPTPFKEIYRLLKPKSYFINIEIGEKDCQEIKKIFGRGQNFGKWNINRINTIKTKTSKLGFKIVFAKDYFYNEYYTSFKDLNLFLQGVPVFEDFDSKKDKNFLKKYVKKFKTTKGVRLARHRLVIILKKT